MNSRDCATCHLRHDSLPIHCVCVCVQKIQKESPSQDPGGLRPTKASSRPPSLSCFSSSSSFSKIPGAGLEGASKGASSLAGTQVIFAPRGPRNRAMMMMMTMMMMMRWLWLGLAWLVWCGCDCGGGGGGGGWPAGWSVVVARLFVLFFAGCRCSLFS